MSEDTQNIENTEPTGNESTPQISDVEKRARDMGWVPQDEYTGDPVKWKSAEVFVALDEPIKRIESQSQELKQVRKALEALKQHHSKVAETEYQRAIRDLKSQRKQALVDGDIDTFERLEDEIEIAKEQFTTIKQAAQSPAVEDPQPVVHPEFRSWLNRNSWYESYSYMRQFADDAGAKFHRQGLDRAEVLKKVEEAVRKEFPNKFTNPNKERAPGVEEGGTKSGKRTETIELNEQERNIMNTLVRSGALTKEQYIADLKKAKGL